MALKQLPQQEQDVILACLVAILRGPFISDPAFHPMVGIHRADLERIIESWPDVDEREGESVGRVGINNCMLHMLSELRVPSREWDQWMSVPREEVRRIFRKWKDMTG